MISFALWLKSTWLASLVTGNPWVWPAFETLHFMGLAVLVGVAGLLDLRLLGFMRRVPVQAFMDFMPCAIAGFVVNLITGTAFFIGAADQYITNFAFHMKLLFLLVAGGNALYFQLALLPDVRALGPEQAARPMVKVVAATSLVSWFAVMYWGRMLPFIGEAF
jgi:hypothetical protein